MNAVVKPKWRRLKTELVEDVKFGAPLETLQLEADECVTWADEEGQGELFAHHFLDGVAEIWDKDFDPNVRKRFDDLCKKVMDGTISADELIERLDIQGGSKNEIYKAADVMGRLYLSQGKRMLNFNPTDTAFGKNPAQLPPLEVPHHAENPQFLAGVIAQIKAELNKQSESQKEVASMLADWKAKIDEAKTADDFSALIPQTQELDERVRDNVKRLLTKVAKSKGFQFDKKAGKFSAAEAKAA